MAFDSSRSVVAQWNELALEAIRLGDPVPTEITRALHIAHSAIYDAWAAYDAEAAGYYFQGVATGEDTQDARAEAVNYAAFHALSEVFPDQVYLFKDFLTSLGFDPDLETTDLSTPGGVGIAAAQTVISARANDGANSANDFEDTSGYEPGNSDDPDDPDFDPNLWTPLRVPTGAVRDENGIPIATDNPASYKVQEPISPHWGSVDPFAIEDSDDYLPPAPPKLGDFSEYVDATGKVTTGDAAYREQFGALVDISANLTTEQKVIAEYWADGPQTSTPPGHWNEIAQDVSVREGYGLDEDVKLFFALNNALFDAGIAIWDAKYTYDYVRPQTAIRHLYDGETISSWAGPNQGTQDIAGGEWIPYQNVTFVTPAFPEYTSGHSGFSYAAATIIEAFTGTDVYYDGTSRGAYDLDGDGERDLLGQYVTDELAFEDGSGDTVTLQWASLWDAAAEAGLSRLYGGIHIQDGDLFGRQIGAEVAEDVWGATRLLFDQDGDNVFDASEASTFHLGAGSDEIIGALADLDGLQVFDFGRDDVIRVSGLALPDGGFAISPGSAVLELDQDGDGTADAIITLEGDYDDDRFIAVEVDGQTTLRIATDADVELTDTAERFITTDASANVVAAGDGDDVLVSAGGGDVLDGDGGNDVLLGGDEDDILIGGGGGDVTTGGAGADIFSFDASDAPAASGFTAEFITDFESGVDKVELSGYVGLSFDTFSWTPAEAGVALVLPNNRFIVFEGIDDESELSAQDFVFPTSGRDVVFAESKPQILTDADDRYVSSGSVADDVDGRGGDDAIITGDGADFLGGGIGDDVLNAGAGEDTLAGGSGADNLTGGADADLFRFFGSDDPAGSGFVADFVTDYEAGIDRFEIFGFAGIGQFSDISFLALEAGLGANLGGGRFIVFEGVFDQADLNEGDFTFTGDAPDLALALRTDTGTSASDQVTSDEAIIGGAFDDVGIVRVEVRIEGQDDYKDATSFLQEDGNFVLDALALEELFGTPVADGLATYEVRVTDIEGNQTEDTISYTLDRAAASVADAPSGIFDVSPDTLTVAFTEAMANGAFDATAYALRDGAGQSIEITSIDRINDTTARLNLADTLRNDDYTLEIPAAADIAGNAPAEPTNATFTVDALTRIVNVGPTEGTKRANLDRQIVVEFDRPVDRSTVDAESFQVIALGEPLEGRITVSSNGQVITFFPDDLLPAATELRIKVDGDKIIGEDGSPIDADGDGSPGGTLESDFQTITLTRVPDTNIEGFIFDANYRDDDGLDIPLEGVVVSVVGLPNVSAVTDENGRFFLEDLPIPQVYLEFDASNVTNRPDFDYGTIDKPVDTIAGQTVGLSSGDKAFNIYFAALAEGDVTEIIEGEETEAGIGENGLANLTEIFPNIDPSEWEKLKVTIPADSLSFDDGTLAEEVSVMVFEPDRIPAPLPPGFDPTVVFTVKAGDATNVDGKAQIDFPNLDGLALGEKRPILSFDHDAGEWVQSGTAIVVDDGNGGTVLRSEGDTGVNTLGWKGIGGNPVNPVCDKPDDSDPLPDQDGDGIPDEIDPDANGDGIPDEEQEGDVEIEAGLNLFGDLPQIFARLRFGIDLPLFLFDLDEIVSGGSTPEEALGILFDKEIRFPKEAIRLSEDFSFSTVVGSFTARFIPEINVNLANAKFFGEVRAGLNVSGKVEIEAGDDEIDLKDVVVNPGGVTAAGRVEYDAGFLSGLPFVGGLFKGDAEITKTLFGLPEIDLNEIFGDIEFGIPFAPKDSGVDEFFAGIEASAGITASFGANAFIRKSEITASSSSFASLDQVQPQFASFDTAFASTVSGDMTFDQVQQNVVLAALTTDDINISTSMSVANDDRFYYLIETASEVIFRGSVARGQTIDELLPGNEEYTVYVYAPLTNRWGIFASEDGQVPFDLKLNNIGGFDQDGDLIPYVGEYVLGTSDLLADTDGDGITDSAELDQGLNPLDGVGFPTGLIGNVTVSGNARDLDVIGALDRSGGQTAFLATGDYGLAVIDASDFANPILQSQVDLSGENSRVVVDATRDLAFVASTSGVHIVDVADPLDPQLVQTASIPGGAKSLLLRDGVLFVGGRDLYVVNPVAGAILAEIDTSGSVTDIAADGDTIYAVVNNETLVSYAFNGQFLVELDSVTIPTPPVRRQPFDDFRIFISNDVAYVSNGFDLTVIAPSRPLERGGYVTFDVADPENLALISNIDTPAVQAANLQTVTNGAGLGLVAAGQRGLQIHDTSDPENTYDLIAEFDTPGDAQAVALASGIAYVADGNGGLQVINFLPFDADGQAPTVTFNSTASDADGETPGIQIEEGETIRLDLGITDDVQIRNVELLVNGQVVLNDVSAPYELAFAVPALSAGTSSVEISVRATDTGGNSTTSDSVIFEIIPDNTPPEVLAVSPPPDRLILVGESTVTISFSEPLDSGSISAADVTIEAADGSTVTAKDLTLLVDDQVALFTFDPLAVGDYTLNFNLAGVEDRAGNAIIAPPAAQSISVVDATAVWNDPAGGNWFDASKWRDGVLPDESDGVAVVVDEGSVVTANSSAGIAVERILLQGILQFSAGTLSTDDFQGVSGELRQFGGTIANTTLSGEPDFSVNVTGGLWSGVTLDADAGVGDVTFSRALNVDDGLTVDGDLAVRQNARVELQGTQTVDGTGTITLEGSNALLRLLSQEAGQETVTLGPDLTVQGFGTVSVNDTADDRLAILGDVFGDDGTLLLNYIDNAGAALSLDSASDGSVTLQTSINNAAVEVAAGADVRVVSGQLNAVSLGGAGTTRIESATVSDLTVVGAAEIEAASNAFTSPNMTVTNDLTVEGTLSVSGNSSRTATLQFTGAQLVDGAGQIVLSRNNAIGEEAVSNTVRLNSALFNEREVLTFGEDLDLVGAGIVTISRTEDRIQVLGEASGASGDLVLRYIDNDGAVLTVDNSLGAVTFGTLLEDVIVTAAAGTTGAIGFESNTVVSDVTFNTDAVIEGATPFNSKTVTFEDAITLNGTLSLATQSGGQAILNINGEQILSGTGTIDLSRANLNPGQTGTNQVDFNGDLSGTAEVLTFGAGVEIKGDGLFFASQTEDSLKILGQVTGVAGQTLTLRDVNNAGGALNVDASFGTVLLGDRVTDTTVSGEGSIGFESTVTLDSVTLAMDAGFGGANFGQTIFSTGGLTVDETLTVAAGQNWSAYLYMTGEQTLGGLGTITLSDDNAAIGNFDNRILFDGVLSGSETLTIAADTTVTGQGYVYAQDSGDNILLDGTLIADDGQLRVDDLQALEGVLGATADGELDINTTQTLTERGTLSVGLAGSGTDQSAGRIDHNSGQLTLAGTLALDLADDFDAALGDTFDIITSQGGFAGSFDAFEGFAINDQLGFELTQSNSNTLTLEVVTLQDATTAGFVGRPPFNPEPKPPFVKDDVILTDAQARVVDATIIGDETTQDNGPDRFENVTFQVDFDRQAILSDVVGTFEQGLELDNVTFTLAGSQQAEVSADFDGAQTVSGVGTIDFIRDSGFGLSAQHILSLSSQLNGPEVLTIEDGVTIQGHVRIGAAQPGVDSIKMLGTLKGTDGSTLTVRDIDNDGADLTVDASAGTVFAGSALREARFVDADGTSGLLKLQNGATLQDITLAMDSTLDASGAGSIDVNVVGGLTLEDSTLTLQGFNNLALLDFLGAQSVSGTGTIVLAENLVGPTDNDIRFDGFESFSETLSFGAGITLRGTGLIDALGAGDKISILGNVVGDGSGILVVNDLDNAGGTVTVDASAGAVGFGSGIANATIAASTSNTGAIDLLGNGGLRNVTLGIDTRMDVELSSLSATVREGLTLSDAMLTLAGSEFATATLTFFGEQDLSGTGTLLLSNENAVDGRAVNNQLTFTGTKGGQETFTITDGVTLEGNGRVTVSAGDILDIEGDVTATTGGRIDLERIGDVSGELTATAGSVLSVIGTIGLDAGAGVTIGLAGSGADTSVGILSIGGLLQRGGTFTFDLAPDFDAAIGDEFRILGTTEGFTDSFASVAGATIDATKGLALVQDGTSIFARVVDIAQAGQQLTRADLPAVPLVPVISQNVTAATIDQDFIDTFTSTFATEDYDAIFTSGLWSGVTLDADAGVGDVTFSRALNVDDGLTVDGDLAVRQNARVELQGTQTVDGTGTITLEGSNALLRLLSQEAGQETVTLGPDLTVQGFGTVSVNDTADDRLAILGDVFGDDGTLLLNYIDNAGAALSLDSASDGSVTLQTSINNAAVEVAAGADVRVVSGQLNAVSLGGAGTTRIESATVSDLTVVGAAEIEAASNAFTSPNMTVTNDLTVEGTLSVSGNSSRTATLQFTGAQLVDGAGQIVLSRNNAIGEEAVSNTVRLNSALFNEREVLTFGEDLDLVGAGIVTISRTEDRIQVLGEASGASGDLVLRYIDNDGAVLTVDNSLGAVTFGTLLEDVIVTAAAGTTGAIGFESNTVVSDVTFNTDAVIEGATPFNSKTVTFEDAITLNGTLSLATQSGGQAILNINGEQILSGTGTIDLSRANLNPGQTGTNQVDFNGDLSGTAEVLTFGAGVEIKGDGLFFASQTEDSLKILGQVTGVAGQTLTLRDVNNAGGALNVDASFGTVLLGDRVTDTTVSGEGSIGFESTVTLDSVTLAMDAGFGGANFGQTIFSTGGLTVDETLTVAAGQNWSAYLYMTGEQTLGGLGTITLSDDNAAIGNFDNRILFDGVLSGSETLTIAADTTVTGQGYVYAQDSGDNILLDGTLIADDGQLRVDDLQALEGVLGATADGELDINTTQTLTERGTLSVGLAGSGTDQSAGRIDHNSGQLTLAGTLALDLADDFDAALGDTFDIITSQGGFAGSFDAFEGFAINDQLGFELTQSNSNTLTLEVVTLQDATTAGFGIEDTFIFEFV